MGDTSMITKTQFKRYCDNYRKITKKIDLLCEADIDLINFCDAFWQNEGILMTSIFGEINYDLISDYLNGSWDGKIYQDDKLIEEIKSDEDLYGYLVKTS